MAGTLVERLSDPEFTIPVSIKIGCGMVRAAVRRMVNLGGGNVYGGLLVFCSPNVTVPEVCHGGSWIHHLHLCELQRVLSSA